jgi:glycerol 2-dehydrogenase (NADP+)
VGTIADLLFRLIRLGTWKSEAGQVEHAVETALKSGYRHIDTASAYGSCYNFSTARCCILSSLWLDNEKQVGEGIKASGVPRSEIFLTTKLNNNQHRDVLGSLNKSLELLDTDYVDLCAWPSSPDRPGSRL